MKKTVLLVLSVAVVLAALSGCFSRTDTPEEPSDPPVSSGPESQPEPEGPPEEPEPDLPEFPWEVDEPENQGMDGALLETLHEVLADTEIYSFVTVRNGYLVDEYYADGYDEASVFRLNSCSKSFTSALIGIAIDEGLIEGVDVPISRYFPELEGTDKEEITIRHLLEHTSGIQWYEWNSGSTFREWRQEDNWVEFVLNQPMDTAPGAVFNYSTGGPHLLAAILQQATGQTAAEYCRDRIFAPLGIASGVWNEDPEGITDGGNGVSMTARDAAKFGQLFLQNGVWDGEQIVSREWVEESTRRQSSGTGSSGVYGYQWWIQNWGGYDSYYAMGHAGQFIFVVPDLDLVTVVTSPMSQGTYEPRPYFADYVVGACIDAA